MPDQSKGEIKAKDDLKKDVKVKGGESKTWQKYKWWIIGGGIVVALIIVWYIHSQGGQVNAAATQAADGSQSDIDPATGFPYGSASDLAALGESQPNPSVNGTGVGSDGSTGAAGATGATGATGKAGKPEDLWDIAINILKARGVKSPTHNQIEGVWNTLRKTGEPKAPAPKKAAAKKPVPKKK